MGVCKKLRNLLDAISLFRNTLTLHRKRTRSSSIALGIVNPSLTCQQPCRLGNNNAHALYNYKMRTRYRTTKRVRVLQFHNACVFCKFKKINKKHTVPHPRVIFTEQDREKEHGRVPKERGRVPIPPFEDKSFGESSY